MGLIDGGCRGGGVGFFDMRKDFACDRGKRRQGAAGVPGMVNAKLAKERANFGLQGESCFVVVGLFFLVGIGAPSNYSRGLGRAGTGETSPHHTPDG